MIELVVYMYLKVKLDVPVYMEKQREADDVEYVLIEKTGSSVYNHIRRATFAVQSYSNTMYKAALLNEKVKEAMDGLVALDEISKSSLNSDYYFNESDEKHYRYQAVYDLVHF